MTSMASFDTFRFALSKIAPANRLAGLQKVSSFDGVWKPALTSGCFMGEAIFGVTMQAKPFGVLKLRAANGWAVGVFADGPIAGKTRPG